MNSKDVKAGDVIEQIDKYRGNLSAVARAFGVTRQTIYNMCAKHPTVQAALDNAREVMIDEVENSFYEKAVGGDVTAQIFFLKTQGKRRGYTERIELDLNFSDLTDAELQAIIDGG